MEKKDRNIYLYKDVNCETINELTRKIIEINEADRLVENELYYKFGIEYISEPIKLYIDSYGGDVHACLGLIDIMQASETKVNTVVTGCAMSCGFLIAVCGHERFAHKNSTFLYHQISSMAWGNIKQMEQDFKQELRLQKIIETIVKKQTSISAIKLKEVYDGKLDWCFGSKEALEMGCIDKIL